MSMPAPACFSTTWRTERSMAWSSCFSSIAAPSSRWINRSDSSSLRGKLPTWVTSIRSRLIIIFSEPLLYMECPQSTGACAAAGDALVGRGPTGVEGAAGRVDVDHQRRMVRGYRFSFARFPVDLGPDDARLQRGGHQQVVDTHAKVFVEVAGAVVPPRVPPRLAMAQPVGINEPTAAKACERLPLRFGHVRSAMAGAGVPHIDVFGRHIQVTAEHDRRVGVDRLVEPSRKPIEPHELGLVKRRANDTAVRRVHADHTHAAAFGGDHAGLREGFVVARIGRLRRPQRLAKVGDYAVDAAAARDGDAVPSPFAMVRQRIARLT